MSKSDESLQTCTIGWIGAGRMGFSMAKRLLEAGCDVSIYNRTRSKAEPLVALGGKLVSAPRDLADRDIVFTMVSASDDLIAVTCGENGVLSGETSPRLMIDCSSVSEEASAKVRAEAARRKTDMLAAPVSGNAKVVRHLSYDPSGRGRSVIKGGWARYYTARLTTCTSRTSIRSRMRTTTGATSTATMTTTWER